MTARRLWALAAALAAAFAGCAPQDPYTSRSPSPPRHRQLARPGGTVPAGELPGSAPRRLLDEPRSFPEGGSTPPATLALAARLYGNWTSTSAPHRLERMAALCVGQARAELRQAATEATVDRQQRGARSQARLEATSVHGHGSRRRALVVTRERVAAPDLPVQGWRYRVTLVSLEHRPEGWLISRWAPQP
jgi:hypothetical protein